MSLRARFLADSGQLDVFGDNQNDTSTISRDAAGKILVNGGAVPIDGGSATVANTGLIEVFGQGGNDTIALDEANGALPAANLFGGAGNDTITGGSGNDQLFGQAGDDTLLGKGGDDRIFGGDGNDTITGGAGSDQVFGGAGNDRLIWNPGDGSDVVDGGTGNDTVEVNLGNASEAFTIQANGDHVLLARTNPGPFTIDASTVENFVINANGGDDVITAGNGLAGVHLTIDGGAGNDTITGGDGNDLLIGGDGNDLIIGGRGNDTAQLGAGDDVFVWNPGDGSDTVDGGTGFDTLVFNGANIDERMSISARTGHAVLTRDVGTVTMDLAGVERIAIAAGGGADSIVINDLTGTDVKQVAIDLAVPPGSGTGDGMADSITIGGTASNDAINVLGSAGSVDVQGLPAEVTLAGAEGANDSLLIAAGAGDDTINASGLAAGVVHLTIDGGAGNDTITGSAGDDLLLGGAGNDFVVGGRGNDTAQLGDGNDTFVWNPGDGSDAVDGGAGTDTLLFNGAAINENVTISANGDHALFTRNIANIVMDLHSVEHIQFNALGGADNVVVDDLTGTGVKLVAIDLSQTAGSGIGDGQSDNVSVSGTAGNDHISVVSSGASVLVNGLAAQVTIAGAEGANDSLVVHGQDGNDVINASGLNAGAINLTIDGGAGNDVITGSAGDDVFVWNSGDGSDTVDGQAGIDTLVFNGANIAENIELSANGALARLVDDVGKVTMDVDGVENIDINARGGADNVTVDDMTGTAVKQVNIDLTGTPDGTAGDGETDNVVINGTSGDDAITLSIENGTLVIGGLASTVVISHFDPNDTITINGLGGDDVIDASGIGTNGPKLVLNGGDGADVLIGSHGNDTINGGAGDDVLIGNGGVDALDGGTGANTILQAVVQPPIAQTGTDKDFHLV